MEMGDLALAQALLDQQPVKIGGNSGRDLRVQGPPPRMLDSTDQMASALPPGHTLPAEPLRKATGAGCAAANGRSLGSP